MDFQVTIQWTVTANKMLAGLPKKVRRGIYQKVDDLTRSDPRLAGKPLVGPLQGYRRVTYGRFRAIFRIAAEKRTRGKVVLHITVIVIAVGIRRERDKRDVYKVAQQLLELGIIPEITTDN